MDILRLTQRRRIRPPFRHEVFPLLNLLVIWGALVIGDSNLSAQIVIGQFTGSPITTVYGQSFIAADLGPNGSGVPPLPGDLLTLNSFTFAFGTSGSRDAVASLSIYDSQAAAANQSPALFTSTSFTDSTGHDPNFAYPSRTYVFTSSITLTAGSLYYAGLFIGGNIASSSTNLYTSGGILPTGSWHTRPNGFR